jgi:RNA polymerase sigma factor (sigma-70 family)
MTQSRLITEITKVFREEIRKLVKEQTKAKQYSKSVYQMTEKLLYTYPALKLKIEMDTEELSAGNITLPERSHDVVKYRSGGAGFLAIEIQDRIEDAKRRLERTELQVRKIEKALGIIKKDDYYLAIELKYFDKLTLAQIAERFDCDESTISRHNQRLVNEIGVMLFGIDAV